MRRALFLALIAVWYPLQISASSWRFWDHYAAHFVRSEGRVIDPQRNSMTTSEGQSYAMFFALVANDKAQFEHIRAWTEGNLARGNLAKNLPSWSWGEKPDGSWGILDQNTAADADLWIAFSLIEAGELWGTPRYTTAGRSMLHLIADQETSTLPQVGAVLLPGRNGFASDSRWLLNPSYMPLPLITAAAREDAQGPWRGMASALPDWLQKASPAGFAMDWVEFTPDKGFAPAAGPGASQPRGSYDAIRVYLWAGMTPREMPGSEKLLTIFEPMLRYMKTNGMPPETVNADGSIANAQAPEGFTAAMVPFLLSDGEKNIANTQLRALVAHFEPSTGLIGDPPRYYAQNLALFALGWQEGRFRFAPDGALRVPWKK